MQRLQGIAVSPGVAIGEALVMGHEGFRIPRRFVTRDAIDDETDRLEKAIAASGDEISANRKIVCDELGEQYAAIFDAHLQMLRDAKLHDELVEMIRQRHYSPEYAVSRTLRRYAKVFREVKSGYLAERASDVVDIEKRLLRNLLGIRREELANVSSPVIVLAHNLTPSETANLNRDFVRAFVTEVGGPGSHTAIVAGALEIPAVVGVGPFLTEVSGGDQVIIDGDQGVVILHPDEETLARYHYEAERNRAYATQLESLRTLPADTADGVHIELLGNIEFSSEVRHCLDRGGAGVGLYRTEFLYLGAEHEPTEEVQFEAYSSVIEQLDGQPLVIRTLDLGADKVRPGQFDEDDKNPFLGLRSIRLSLRETDRFRTQLRAVLRASALGDVRVMFPLVSTVLELRKARMVLHDVMEDLEDRGIPFNRDLPVGMMVEVPAAVVMIDHFVPDLDFFSIGTNDLIQYTLAVDRDNKEVADLYNACDPAVLRLIQMAVNAGRRHNKPVNVCGQMSGNPVYTMLLIGMGLRQMSVRPSAIPEIKKVCRSVTTTQCEDIAARAARMDNARDIKNFLKDELRKLLPEISV
ncbi:MAG: phosphoenolpyruvate--protein phosphotransferase [Pirellulales bacterium]|nr:phosphoenolpyruvate--protein phosphotransferase [Planctomycetales bacterium]